MGPVATELHWQYEPPDFFETAEPIQLEVGSLSVDGGKAILRLAGRTDPVSRDECDSAIGAVVVAFDVRRLLVHRDYSLQGPHVVHVEADGKRHVTMFPEGIDLRFSVGTVDVRLTDAQGNVVRDTRAERVQEHQRFIQTLARKASRSPLLQRMLASYGAAVSDPDDELVHLYEVRDVAVQHFGGGAIVRERLGLTRAQFSTLGSVANDQPLLQGRHRGRHLASLRPASQDELKAARASARMIIERFADTITT